MKIGFIGCGNMAKPIISGMADAGVCPGQDIWVTDLNREDLETFCEHAGVSVSNQEAILCHCDAVVLAVKPQVLPALLPQLSEKVNERKPLVISIAAGKTTDSIASYFAPGTAVARISPNLNAKVKAAVSAYCANSYVSGLQLELVKTICESFGAAFAVPEEKINIFGVLGGCAPAYTFMYIDALAKAAEEAGFEPEFAALVAAKMAEGSAKLLAETTESAAELVKKVCSPGGTTIEGVKSLEQNGFPEAVHRAFNASLARDAELSQ